MDIGGIGEAFDLAIPHVISLVFEEVADLITVVLLLLKVVLIVSSFVDGKGVFGDFVLYTHFDVPFLVPQPFLHFEHQLFIFYFFSLQFLPELAAIVSGHWLKV